MPILRLFAFMLCFLEFIGSYIQTKSGDEEYQGRDEKLPTTEEPWPCGFVPQGQWLNDCSQSYRPPPSWSPSWSRVTLMS